LRNNLQQQNTQNKSKVLDNNIDPEMPHPKKFDLGDNQIERGSISKTIDQETQPIIYAEKFRGDKSFTGKITGTLLHLEDSDFRINNSQKQAGLTKTKDLEEQLPLKYLQLLGIKLYFFVYVMHVIIFDIKM
jgi:hypothetical protein